MSIGIDISQVVYRGTGVSTYTENLVKNLLKIDSQNQYTLFGSAFRHQKDLNNFYNSIVRKEKLIKRFYPFPPRFYEILWNNIHKYNIENFIGKIDVFHTSDWTEPPAQAPKITTIHDMVVMKFPRETHPRIKNNQELRFKWVKKESKIIIADSKATKQDIIDLLKIPEEKIKVVYLAPGEEYKRENLVLKAEVVREKYGITNNYFLTVGTREPRKNLKRAINAYNKFKHKTNVDLIVVGKFGWGVDIKEVEGLKILEFIQSDELAILYQEAIALVYPSLYEGFGLPVLEAESMGCPVISSGRGSLKEITSKKSVIINPENENSITEGMEYLYSIYETDKYFEMMKEGIEFSKNFSWEKTARETLKIYEEVAKEQI